MNPEWELWVRGLKQGRAMRYYELSTSMVPAIKPGDYVTIIPDLRWRVGGVIFYRRDDSFVLHRVVTASFQELITKGDALFRLDPPVPTKDILGRAVSLERNGKIHDLDSFRARWLGLAYSWAMFLVSPLAPYLPATVRQWARKQQGLIFS